MADKLNSKPKRGIIPTIKSYFLGDMDQVEIAPDVYRGVTTQTFFQRISGSHSFNMVGLRYLVNKGYKQNAIVFGIITKICLAQRNIIFKPYWKGEPYKSKQIDFDINYALFNLITTGTAIIWKRKIVGFGIIHETLDTLRITETATLGKFTYKYEQLDGTLRSIPTEELIIIPWAQIDTTTTQMGISPLQAAIMPIEALEGMWTADTSSVKNKGVDVLISTEGNNGPLLADENETIDETLNKRISGARRSGRVAVTGANVKVHQLGRSAKELALWDGYKIKQRDLCTALQVDSGLFNDQESNKFSNRQEGLKSLYNECVIPLTKIITENKDLVHSIGYEIFLDTSNIEVLQDSQQVKAEKAKLLTDQVVFVNQQVNNGTISRDIAVLLLVEFGFDPKEAEKYVLNQNLQVTL